LTKTNDYKDKQSKMYYQLPAPIACGMLGAIAGLVGGGMNQCYPVWVGGVTGLSIGTAMSLIVVCKREEASASPPVPVQQPIYIIYEISGQDKHTIPVAQIVEPIRQVPSI